MHGNGGHVWWEWVGMHGEWGMRGGGGACMVGGMHGREACMARGCLAGGVHGR